jgi:RNA polymerase sigma-70 factor (ECF subfamily)
MRIGHTQSKASAKFSTAVPSEASDHALIQSMADGDKRAFKMLYVRHHVRVFRLVMRIVGNESTAEEVVNEVFLEAWRHAPNFKGRSQVTTWLLAIARFKTITKCRRRSEAQLDETVAAVIEDPADTPSISMEKNERSDILQECLAKLTPIHREVINLIYYQEKRSRKWLNSPARRSTPSRHACTMQESAWPSCSRKRGSIGPGQLSSRRDLG